MRAGVGSFCCSAVVVAGVNAYVRAGGRVSVGGCRVRECALVDACLRGCVRACGACVLAVRACVVRACERACGRGTVAGDTTLVRILVEPPTLLRIMADWITSFDRSCLLYAVLLDYLTQVEVSHGSAQRSLRLLCEYKAAVQSRTSDTASFAQVCTCERDSILLYPTLRPRQRAHATQFVRKMRIFN
jgi:hypothetical protein